MTILVTPGYTESRRRGRPVMHLDENVAIENAHRHLLIPASERVARVGEGQRIGARWDISEAKAACPVIWERCPSERIESDGVAPSATAAAAVRKLIDASAHPVKHRLGTSPH